MFSSLSKGNILYGLNTRNGVKAFTGTVEKVSLPMPKSIPVTFGQMPETVVDITAIVNGDRKEFKQIPSSNAIADFGTDAFVLADNRDSLISYVNSMLQASKNVVSSIDRHKELIEQYSAVLAELEPSSSNTEVRELKEEVGGLKSQLSEILSLLKPNTDKEE